ncbi:uncharacterized protein LOC112529823 [Cynara cardunculus var. scolymus]|uniref:uncharacterized protein LOC112529823 n=1 Tax=Cynara cardunculus var. scolymus TaxID=59895 RepID=UPI000D63125C|nr:uncharacterized protein LOC112529823 [Cynara cardunculus var. scolymus]
MSLFKFKSLRKLLHVKKTCKSFTEIFRSKFHKIKFHKAIKKVTTFLVSSRYKIHIRPMRQRFATSHHHHLLQKGFPAIFIDELYVSKSSQQARVRTTGNDEEGYVTSTRTSTSGCKVEKNVATEHDSLPREKKKDVSMIKDRLWTRDIRGVDERAEDFIFKVREEMKLQREQSILDFQEMLARSI